MTGIVIPTFNEAGNLPTLMEGLSGLGATILIVDDGSTDGTQDIAEELATVIQRAKSSLASAYVKGMGVALEMGLDPIVQMDADLSHQPSDVPRLLAAAENADLVLGSRWVDGGGIENWETSRELLSKFGSGYARTLLSLPYQDLTGGFKAWRAVLAGIDLPHRSEGYAFQVETTHRAHRLGASITEIPIVFADRLAGQSKMSWSIGYRSGLGGADASLEKWMSKASTTRRLLSYFRPHRKRFALAVVLMALQALIPGTLVLLIETVLDDVLIAKDATMLALLPPLLVGLYVLGGALTVGRGMLTRHIAWDVITQLRSQVFWHLLRLDARWHQKNPTGETLARLSQDVHTVQYGVSGIVTAIQQPLTLVVLLGAAAWMNPWLTAMAVVVLPLVAWPIATFGRRLRMSSKASLDNMADLSATAARNIVGNAYGQHFWRRNGARCGI